MKISVLQWNVLYTEKADNVLQFIKQTGADIVCLQELTQNSVTNPNRDLPSEIADLGYQSYYEATDSLSNLTIGNGIFSKFPLSDSRSVYVSETDPNNNDYPQFNRAYIETTLNLDGSQLTVGTAHLSYTPGFEFFPGKRAESEKFIKAVRSRRSRYLLTGDFNATPDSSLIQDLNRLLVPSDPNYNEATWTTKPFEMHGFAADTLDWRLDYVFTSSDIKVLSTKIVETEYSDHLPILTTLVLKD